jgi:hypothetical protein
MTFRKEASGTDQYFVAINELRPPFVIQLTVEGVGDPSPDELDEALERAAEVNPGCSMILDESVQPAAWGLGPRPTLTVLDAPDFDGDSDREGHFLMWPMDAKVGPTCELYLVRGHTKRWLIFRALHAVMDGQGTILWAKDVMRCLRGEAPIGHPSPITVDQLIRKIDGERRPHSEADAIHPFVAEPHTEQKFHWRRINVPRPLDGKASGRIAVALAELARERTAGVVRLNLPTDLRSYVPDERTTGNLFGCLSLEVPVGASPDAIGLKIIQQLYKKEGARPVGLYSIDDNSASMALLRVKTFWDLNHLHDTGRYLFSATLSHLGVLKSADLSGGGFTAQTAFFVPLVGDAGCVVSLSGFDDHTAIAVGLTDRFCGDGQLDKLATRIGDALRT